VIDQKAPGLPFPELKKNQQTGSKPRCHLFASGTKDEVASRLTALIERWGEVLPADAWMPDRFTETEEAELHKAERIIPDSKVCDSLLNWWLTVPGARTKTPSWDIASI
jgi:hypothetical protein